MVTISRLKWLVISTLFFNSLFTFSQKKIISITSKIEIKATQTEIFTLLKNLNRYPEWSPFLATDPKQKYNISGKNGEIGSTFYWEGVDEKSKGFQTLSSFTNNEYIKFNCTVEKPFKGNPVFEYRFIEKGDKIEVVQDFNLHLSRFSYFMTKLFNVKKKMVATNKLGLERLKALVERESNIK